MKYYIILASSTIIIGILAVIIWRKTKNITFPLGIAFIYYWTIYGGWTIVNDRLGGEVGIRYGYIEKMLFPLYLDNQYFYCLILYSIFILLIELTILLKIRNVNNESYNYILPRKISHYMILCTSTVAAILSYYIIRDDILSARSFGMSAYVVSRGGLGAVSPYFTIHQILNRVALIPTALGFAIYCSGNSPRFLSGNNTRCAYLGYMTIFAGMIGFSFLLGNKNELFFAGTVGILFYLANARRARVVMLTTLVLVGFVGLGFVDLLRAVPLDEITDNLGGLSISEFKRASLFITSSNEAFGAHFSLYGAISNDIPVTFGSSVVSLAASVIPRILWPNRPNDIYVYYADNIASVARTRTQGFSIHHATGWYLNFGIAGIAIGAIILGLIWSKCYYLNTKTASAKSRWSYIFRTLAPIMFVGFLPSLIRGGIEGYKGLIIVGYLIPVFVLNIASYKWVPSFRMALKNT